MTVPAQELTLLTASGHRAEFYASFLKPETLWTVLVDGAHAVGETTIAFRGGFGTAYSAVEASQVVWVGDPADLLATPESKDTGTPLRIRAIASADGGVTGTIEVSPNNVSWVDGLFLVIKHDYSRVFPMYPYIDPTTEQFYKDRDIPWTDETTSPGPVVVVDFSHRAQFLRNGEAVFWFDMDRSYTTAEGATVTGYAASVYPAPASLDFNGATGEGRIECTDQNIEYYWCKFTVTDSNGKTQDSWRVIFTHYDGSASTTYPHTNFNINQVAGDWDRGGWYLQLMVHQDATIQDIPDETFCIVWKDFQWTHANGTPINVTRSDDILYVDPQIEYHIGNTTAIDCSVYYELTAGILIRGVPATSADTADIFIRSPLGDLTSHLGAACTDDGYVQVSGVFAHLPLSGTLEALRTPNDVITTQDYTLSPRYFTPDDYYYPSPIRVFPQALIVGYVRNENLQHSLGQGAGIDTFEIATVDQCLRDLYMFSVPIESHEAPTDWWQYGGAGQPLTIGRIIHIFWKWQSNIFEVANVVGLMDNTSPRYAADLEAADLYTMADDFARNRGIRAHLVTNKKGDINLVPDLQLLTDAERALLSTRAVIEKEMLSGEIALLRNAVPRLAIVFLSGMNWDGTTFVTDANNMRVADATPYCAYAPSAPLGFGGRGGSEYLTVEFQTLDSQAHAEELAGRYYAAGNNLYPELRLNFHGDFLDILDFEHQELWEIDIDASDTPKGLTLYGTYLILRSVQANINTGTGATGAIEVNAVFEPVATGNSGAPVECPSIPDELQNDFPDPEIVPPPEPEPPDEGTGLGTVLRLANNALGITYDFDAPGGASWDSIMGNIAGAGLIIRDLILDPWRPSSVALIGTDNGVYRTLDYRANPVVWEQLDTVPVTYRVHGSINKDGWFGFAWQSGGNVYFRHSDDFGVTWNDTAITGSVEGAFTTTVGNRAPAGEAVAWVLLCTIGGISDSIRTARYYRTLDGGDSFTQVATFGTTASGTYTMNAPHAPYDGNENENILWSGLNAPGNLGNQSDGLHRRVIGVGTVNKNTVVPSNFRGALETHTFDESQVYYWSGNTLLISVNTGTSWVNADNTGLSGTVSASGGFPYNDQLMYASTTLGIFYSLDRSETWNEATGDWAFGHATGGGHAIVPDWTE